MRGVLKLIEQNRAKAFTLNPPYIGKGHRQPRSKRHLIGEIQRRTLPLEPGIPVQNGHKVTKDGKYVLASLWEMDGALIIYDAATLKEVKRLPMKKPVGKYNVWNKINKSEGTSH